MNEGKQFTGMGASSILMIFVVLCLTTFAILSFVTSYADLRLSRRSQETAEKFYAADARTDEILAEIDNLMISNQSEAQVTEAIKKIVEIESADGQQIVISVPIEENQSLRTVLKVSKANYEVISRKKAAIIEWEEE